MINVIFKACEQFPKNPGKEFPGFLSWERYKSCEAISSFEIVIMQLPPYWYRAVSHKFEVEAFWNQEVQNRKFFQQGILYLLVHASWFTIWTFDKRKIVTDIWRNATKYKAMWTHCKEQKLRRNRRNFETQEYNQNCCSFSAKDQSKQYCCEDNSLRALITCFIPKVAITCRLST